MTVRATYVHKYLRGGYIDALFRRVFSVTPGDKPEQPVPPVDPDSIVLSGQRSGSGLLRGTGLLFRQLSRDLPTGTSAFFHEQASLRQFNPLVSAALVPS
jgi:hypothetical protein